MTKFGTKHRQMCKLQQGRISVSIYITGGDLGNHTQKAGGGWDGVAYLHFFSVT